MDLVFATHNTHKTREILPLLPPDIRLHTLDSLDHQSEIEETGQTLEENARIKARHIHLKYGYPCFADDTGLIVPALGGAPGVYSARYAGPEKNAADNMRKLLQALGPQADRSARFETVIALTDGSSTHLFKGIVTGIIAHEPRGKGGFGYDPIFIPDGYDRTFAELPLSEKNRISHRARAISKLIDHLNKKGYP